MCQDVVALVIGQSNGHQAKMAAKWKAICSQQLPMYRNVCTELSDSFLKQVADERLFEKLNRRRYGRRPKKYDSEWNVKSGFSSKVFCDGAVNIIIAARIKQGPDFVPGVLNTPH